MTTIPIQDLRARLSAVVAEAESGRTVVITRHNQPVAQLGPASALHVHHGRRVGNVRLEAAVSRGTKGRYLAVLLEDRGELPCPKS